MPRRVGGQARPQCVDRLLAAAAAGRGDHGDHPVHRVGVRDRPLEGLVAAERRAGDGDQVRDAEPVEHRLLRRHDVAQRDGGEVGAVAAVSLGIQAGRSGGAVGRAEHVGRDDEVPVRVDRLAGSDQPIPPAGCFIGGVVLAGGVLAGGEAVGHEHGIAAARGQLPVAFVGERELGQDVTALQPEVARRPGPFHGRSPQAVPTWMAMVPRPSRW